MTLYLVRHGQSVGNEQKLFFGITDYPLTQLGREQASQAREKLKAVTFTRCCASDLARAWETAALCLVERPLAPEPCPGLREQDMGELEGLDWDGAHARFGPWMNTFLADWFHTPPPGGESPHEMAARVGRCVDEIIARGEDTLVVAHNGSLSLVLKHLGLADKATLMSPEWCFCHGCYTAIRIQGGKAELEGFNL